jgi:hypothetical protein
MALGDLMLARSLLVASFLITVMSAVTWLEWVELTASDATTSESLGFDVALSGSTLITGAPFDDPVAASSGSAYVFERDHGGAGTWGEAIKLAPSDADEFHEFGYAVSISGDTSVVGAWKGDGVLDDAGAAYVFERDAGGPGAWGEVRKLAAADGWYGDYFGRAVAISGDTVVVGAEDHDPGGPIGFVSGTAFDSTTGTLYGSDSDQLLTFDVTTGLATAVGPFGAPTAVAALAFDATSGTLYGSDALADELIVIDPATGATTVVGPFGIPGFQRVDGLAFDTNSATLYGIQTSGAVSSLVTIDTSTGASTLVGGAGSVAALAFDPSTNTLYGADPIARELVVIDTASGAETTVGATGHRLYGLAFDASTAKLDGVDGPLYELVVVDPANGAGSSAGPILLYDSGAAYVFERDHGGLDAWGETTKLVASDAEPSDVFGTSVAVSADTIAVGAIAEGTNGYGAGAVYVFERDAGGSGAWGEVAKLMAADGKMFDAFGSAVSLSGDTLLVGAYRESAAYVFERNHGGPGAWGQVVEIAPAGAVGGPAGHWFGREVSLDGDTALVSAMQDDTAGIDAGAAYVYDRDLGGANNWGLVTKLTRTGVATGDRFGSGTSVDGNVIALGAYLVNVGGTFPGAVYLYYEGGPTQVYCTAGSSGAGCKASLGASGVASATAPSGFTLQANLVDGNRDGLFFYGWSGRQASPWGNGTSYQCIVPPVKRGGLLAGSGTFGTCDGSFTQDLNARWCPTCQKPKHNPGVGATVQAQLWYRDPFSSSNQTTSFSDAVEFTVHP